MARKKDFKSNCLGIAVKRTRRSPVRFNENPTNPLRALQIWQILIGMAHNRQSTNYLQLAHSLGFNRGDVLADKLGHIMHYCDKKGLPPLTILVVKRGGGEPGSGFKGGKDEKEQNALREKVFKYQWYKILPPCPDELAEIYRENKLLKQVSS